LKPNVSTVHAGVTTRQEIGICTKYIVYASCWTVGEPYRV